MPFPDGIRIILYGGVADERIMWYEGVEDERIILYEGAEDEKVSIFFRCRFGAYAVGFVQQ
ncbi:hypothetical protein AGMMS49546_23500 [Spirochaetia bacterium]|nr:hypothetical protein AGMMS49546_23500 [Spirochaetia bacterium]